MATKTTSDGSTPSREIEVQVEKFARMFGISSNDIASGGSILPMNDPTDDDYDRIDYSVGAVTNVANTVVLVWDWETYAEARKIHFDTDTLSAQPEEAHAHGHRSASFSDAVPVVTYKPDPDIRGTMLDKENVSNVEVFYGIDGLGDFGQMRMHPSENFPMRFMDPMGFTDIVVAPRLFADEEHTY